MIKTPKINLADVKNPLEDLAGQFIIGESNFEAPPAWKTTAIGHFLVGCDPRLPVSILIDKSAPIAIFLGWPVHPELGSLSKLEHFGENLTDLGKSEEFEAFLNLLSGRFVAIHTGSKSGRFYLDASGSLSAVYCPSQKMIASTPLLVPHSIDTDYDHELINLSGVPYVEGWYPFGLTNRIGVHRLLPNHFLDLTTWASTRHWPQQSFNETSNIDANIKEIASLIKRSISDSVADDGGLLALTAGRDSRILLACSREVLAKIQVFTAECDWSGYHGAVDIDTARRITKRLNITHIILPFQQPTIRDYKMWTHRTGNCVGELLGLRNIRTMNLLDQMPGVYLCGIASEVGRSRHWKEEDLDCQFIDIRELLNKIDLGKLQVIDRVIEEGEKWLAGLPRDCNTLLMLDLAHLEQKLGCWGGVANYADIPLKRVHPFSQRRIFELMLELPADFRFKQELTDKIIALEWPELLEFPYNEPIGLKMNVWRNLITIKQKGRFLLSKILSRTPFLWRFNPGRSQHERTVSPISPDIFK